MSHSNVSRLVEVVVLKTKNEIALNATTNCDKSVINGSKIIKVDLTNDPHFDILFRNITPTVIDLNVIVSLNLSNCNLNNIPDGFAVLELKYLDLSHNNLEQVPDCIQNGLRQLDVLDLSHNALTFFKDEPKCVKKLRVLNINNNYFSNIPNWILSVNSFNLEELYYSNNIITNLNEAKFLRKSSYELRKLELRNCAVRAEDIKCLKTIRTLEDLDLSNSIQRYKHENLFVSCDHLASLFDKPRFDDRLKILNLNNIYLSFLPEEISQLSVLQELHLKQNDIMWLPETIENLKELVVLDVSYNKIIKLPNFNKMNKLHTLRISCNIISNISEDLPKSLKVLDLYDNNLLDAQNLFMTHHEIKEIDLEKNFFDTASIKIKNYENMKIALRLHINKEDIREDGPKIQQLDVDDVDTSTTDSEDFCIDLIECTDNEKNEEMWEEYCDSHFKYDSYDNGCTPSDNEWTGNESPLLIYNNDVHKDLNQNYPYWAFEDVV